MSWAMTGVTLDFGDELIDRIAERVAERLAEHKGEASETNGWLRGAGKIAEYIDCPRSRIYALNSAHRIPVHHDGGTLIARREDLDAWLREGGALRP
jgi:excisionase family DNA binding protein